METDRNGAPMPVPTDGPSMHDLVCADMQQRKQLGLVRYNTLLQAYNGRDALHDAYEELLDLACYLKQLMVERDNPDPTIHLRRHLIDKHSWEVSEAAAAPTHVLIATHLVDHQTNDHTHPYLSLGTC